MGLDVAIDELYATGWSGLDTSGCGHHRDGRCYPGVERVEREVRELGFEFGVRHVQLFDCFRAEWRAVSGSGRGAVVGQTEAEASVYALAQVRRSLVRVPG